MPTIPRDSVDYIRLNPERGQLDCADVPDAPLCRMRGPVDADGIRRRLASGASVWAEDSVLTVAWEGAGDGAQLQGGIQYPLSRIRGTDLWTIRLRVRDLPRLVLSYLIIPNNVPLSRDVRYTPKHWRGPQAPPTPARATALRGTVVVDSLRSAILDETRRVIVYTPPGNTPLAGVVYLADGGAVHGFAPYVDTLVSVGRLPRVMLVGIETALPRPGDPPGMDRRALEYLWNFDTTNVRFRAFEAFFLSEVLPWAEARHGAPNTRERRAVAGMSNGGGWAIQAALRQPRMIGHALAFSPGGAEHGRLTAEHPATPRARFYLVSGTLEDTFNRAARRWAATFAAAGIPYRAREVVAAHDWQMWAEEFGPAVTWAFGDQAGAITR